ncbi:MAG: chromosome segregation protein SMC [Chloroflexi bacterium]|nr:chromosome segregation protein SMC [Chloroflexota bacterium]
MNLKRLELHGYKSFANRTAFELLDGVTAIVGPNGSGKSNIADAIQWVLGEQAYSAMRAKKTEDMIFAGSASRARMGMAEVSLVLDNTAQWLPIEFSEVTVTRRAFRSGENEYRLNGAKVRLRDLVELLAKGGLGRGSYIVIGQGLIDSAISLRPEERRALLEDAAGIAFDQTKKAETLAKLAGTQENLTRVHDILQELGLRVRRLHDQANRANQFADVQRALAEHLQIWYGHQWQEAQARLALAQQTIIATEQRLAEVRQALQASDAERARLRERVEQQRLAVSNRQRRLNDLQRAYQEAAQQHAVASERLSLMAQQYTDLADEIQTAAELQVERQQHAQLTARAAQLNDALAAASERLSQLQSRVGVLQSQTEKAARQAQAARAEAQRRALTLMTTLAEQTQRLAGARERFKAIPPERERVQAALAAHQSGAQAGDDRLAVADLQRASLTLQQAESVAQASEAQQRATRLQQTADTLAGQVAEAQVRLRAAEVERNLARARGAQALQQIALDMRLDVIGPLHTLYQVTPDYDLLVRGALGLFADALVVRGWDDAHALANRTATRQTIVVMESFSAHPRSQRLSRRPPAEGGSGAYAPTPADTATPQSAFDLIRCAPQYDALFSALLAHVHLNHGMVPRVSAEGDLILHHAIVTADESAPNLSALDEQVQQAQAVATSLGVQLDRSRLEVGEATARSNTLLRESRELDNERGRWHSECEQLARQSQQHHAEIQRLNAHLARLQHDEDRLGAQIEEMEQARQAAEREHAQARHAWSSSSGDAAESGDDALPALRQQTANQETQVALLNQALQSCTQERARLVERIQSQDTQQQARSARALKLTAQNVSLREEIALVESRLMASGGDNTAVQSLQAEIPPLLDELRADQETLRSLETHEGSAREGLYAAEAAYRQALVELQSRQDRATALRDQIEDDVELVSLPTDLPKTPVFVVGDRPVSLPTPASLPDDIEQEIRSLKNKTRWIGNVNLEAPAEYLQEKERFEFLTAQAEDLQQASASLQQIILELDQLMRDKFRETFDNVARAFKDFFRRLFGGGSAELVLTDPQNLITSGIEIIAHPPGKRRQPLGLLSGGERALTACALTFALLKTSPTPFCVLDEVDAALDEANISRFRETLSELALSTQFIVITHNRGTVEAARAVYGISMGADGASQMISLRLDARDQTAERESN